MCNAVQAQRIKFSPEISSSQDTNVISISKIWNNYVYSYSVQQADSLRKCLWYQETMDILAYALGTKAIFYNSCTHLTFSIRKIDDCFYEINSIAQSESQSEIEPIIFKIYKLLAIEVNGQYKLFNYFDWKKRFLNRYDGGSIEFYFSSSVDFDENKFRESIQFTKMFKECYGIGDDNIIIYIIADSIDECWALLGVPYTIVRSEKHYAGCTIYPRTILSSKPNHIHELVHAIMLPRYPHSSFFMHEGIATYYGGASNYSFEHHIRNLQRYIKDSDLDFTNIEELSTINDIYGETPVFYMIGALIVEYVIKKQGHKKLLSLLECENSQAVFKELGVDKSNINNWIIQLIEKHE
jgi:hypothetical protein